MTLRDLIHALIELGTDNLDTLMDQRVRVQVEGAVMMADSVDVIDGFPYLGTTPG